MNKRRKTILIEFIAVIAITVIAVVVMINFKDWVNRSEAIRAMKHLGQMVIQYRQAHRAVPSKSYIDNIKENLEGHARLGDVEYRGLWIDFESTPDEILAYTEKNYHSPLVGKGYVVLRLDGCVEWMSRQEFETLLARQQSQEEKEMLQR